MSDSNYDIYEGSKLNPQFVSSISLASVNHAVSRNRRPISCNLVAKSMVEIGLKLSPTEKYSLHIFRGSVSHDAEELEEINSQNSQSSQRTLSTSSSKN